jgi:hypothetical protein
MSQTGASASDLPNYSSDSDEDEERVRTRIRQEPRIAGRIHPESNYKRQAKGRKSLTRPSWLEFCHRRHSRDWYCCGWGRPAEVALKTP